tara:strand:- start:83 stop:1393 length:1311 start_codon:yes stop_codon:yes gene_type:complete
MAILGSTVDPRLGAVNPAAIQALSQAGAATGQMYQNLGQSVAGVLEDVGERKKEKRQADQIFASLQGGLQAYADEAGVDVSVLQSSLNAAKGNLDALKSFESSLLTPMLKSASQTAQSVRAGKDMAQFEFDLSEIKRENILADKIEFENVLSDLGIKEADFDLARKKDFQQFSLKLDDLSFEKRQKLLDVLKLNHYEKSLEIKGRQDRKDSRKDFKLIQRLEDQSISRAIDQEIGAYNSYEEAIRNAETVADRQRIHREAQIAFGKRGFQLPAFGQTLFSVKDLTQRKLNNEPLPEIPLSVKDAIDSGRFTENEYYQMLIAMNGGLTKEDFGDRGLSLDTPEEIAAKNKLRYNVLRQRLEGEDYKPPSRQYRRGPVYSPGTGMPGGGIASEAYLMMIEDPTNLGLFEDPEDFIDTRLERVMAQAMQGTVINEEEQD